MDPLEYLEGHPELREYLEKELRHTGTFGGTGTRSAARTSLKETDHRTSGARGQGEISSLGYCFSWCKP